MPDAKLIGPLLPPFLWVIETPSRPEDLAKRHHNRLSKEALKNTIERFHRELFPDRFRQDARQKFDHFPRSPKYQKYKLRRYRSTIDLVKTGRTQRWMTRAYKLRIGGTAERGNLKATLTMNFPFKGGSGRFKKVTRQSQVIQKMILELQRFANHEPEILARWFKEEYMKLVDNFRSTRKRKRIS